MKFASILLLPLLVASAHTQTACSSAESAVQAALAKQARALRITSRFALDPPPETYSLVPSLQRALTQAVIQLLKCDNAPSTPSLIQRQLEAALHANRPKAPSPFQRDPIAQSAAGVFGSNLHIAVRNLGQTNQYLGVQITFDADVGEDNVLLLFEKSNQEYSLVADWQSTRFRDWTNLFGDFFTYAVVPGTPGVGSTSCSGTRAPMANLSL